MPFRARTWSRKATKRGPRPSSSSVFRISSSARRPWISERRAPTWLPQRRFSCNIPTSKGKNAEKTMEKTLKNQTKPLFSHPFSTPFHFSTSLWPAHRPRCPPHSVAPTGQSRRPRWPWTARRGSPRCCRRSPTCPLRLPRSGGSPRQSARHAQALPALWQYTLLYIYASICCYCIR